MRRYQTSSATWILGVVCTAALTACGGGGGGDGGSGGVNGGVSGTPSGSSSTQPQGTYWSWRTVPRMVMGVGGFLYPIQVFEYHFVTFFDNGWAYIGRPTSDSAAMRCDGPRSDAEGNKLCVPYSATNGQLTLDGQNEPLTYKGNGVWTYGGKDYTPLPSTEGDKLQGEFTSIDCYLSSCTRAWIEFTSDGRYRLDTVSTSVYNVPDIFYSASGGSTAATGSYRVGKNEIVLTPDGGAPIKVFYFRDHDATSDTVQLGDTRYSIEKPE